MLVLVWKNVIASAFQLWIIPGFYLIFHLYRLIDSKNIKTNFQDVRIVPYREKP